MDIPGILFGGGRKKMELRLDIEADQAVLDLKRKAEDRGRPFRLKKPVRQQAPIGLEIDYARSLVGFVKVMANVIRENIIPQLPQLIIAAEVEEETLFGDRVDQSFAERLAQLIIATRGFFKGRVSQGLIRSTARRIAEQMDGLNFRQSRKVFRSVLGVNVDFDINSRAQIQRFVQENVSLITNVNETFLAETEQVVLRGVRRGLRHEVIAKQILSKVRDPEGFKGRFNKAETRARLIARDQVNKLNGKLTELRQRSAGVTRYIWRTVLDSRVRDEHRRLEGKKFSWTAPPAEGHPGEPIQCRCFAEPILADLV